MDRRTRSHALRSDGQSVRVNAWPWTYYFTRASLAGMSCVLESNTLKDGVITFRMEKSRGDGVAYPPVLPILAATIAATKTGELTFLITERGTPFVKESFGNWFGEACREAGCPGSAHGLRKAGATRAADKGATMHQLMALFGWKTQKMALQYTRKADRRRLAATAGPMLAQAQTSNENVPHLGPGAGSKPNPQKKSEG